MAQDLLRDEYEVIKRQRAAYRETVLENPQPPVVDASRTLTKRHDPKAVFTPTRKINSAKQLDKELERQRRKYGRFLKDLAPPLP